MEHETTTDTTTTTESTAPAGEATRAIDPPSAGLHEMSKADRDSFYSTGKLPDTTTTDTKDAAADSSTATPGEQAAEIAAKDKAPASETGKPAKDKKARNAEDNRVTELLTDRQRERQRADRAERELDSMRQRLEALEKPKADGKKPDSSTAADPSEPEHKKYLAMPGAPKADQFDGDLDGYVAAMGAFIAKQIAREEATGVITERETQQAEYAAAEREMETVITQAATRLQAEEQAFPQLKEKVHPRLKAITPARLLSEGQAIGPHHYAKDQMSFESEHPLQLHAFYSSDEGLAEWQSMMRMGPKQIERTILARDLSFRTSSQGDGKPAAVAAKTFTKAPPPPENPGKKPASVGDPAEKAVQKGDFAEFMRAMDEREGVSSRYSRSR